jgi:prolyl-tRNA editing enzyme YbaK/EbsC (Cys-tRNA(Pro) deacylase)
LIVSHGDPAAQPAASVVLSSPSVQRVAAALRASGLAGQIVELPGAAKTAKAAAEFLGCDVAQIANSLVFRGATSGDAILVMSSGARRVDTTKLSALVGEAVEKATPEFVKERTGFVIGGVAPAGHVTAPRTYVERSLAVHATLWAAAGHASTVFPLSYEELLRITGGVEIDAAQ